VGLLSTDIDGEVLVQGDLAATYDPGLISRFIGPTTSDASDWWETRYIRKEVRVGQR
jgi:hypothetical protein